MNRLTLIEQLKPCGQVIPLDYHLASFFSQQTKWDHNLDEARFTFLIIWLSLEVRAGHVCIDFDDINQTSLCYRLGQDLGQTIFNELARPNSEDWHHLCGQISSDIVSDGSLLSPLLLQGNRLYFQRLWQYEVNVANYFMQSNTLYQVNTDNVMPLLDMLFPHSKESTDIDWQKIAAVTAMTRKIAIISGGPGTGKTSTVSKILAMLVATHQQTSSASLKIIAAAPTGKAAARLTESLSSAIVELPVEESVKKAIPIDGVTLHRLLGARMDRHEYRYNKTNKLNVDILLIDEASMVDLSMMARVIDALPEHTRLILLGDKEQLSSVEAGAVFGDLCQLSEQGYSEPHIAMINHLTDYNLTATHTEPSFSDNVCLLRKSYRFDQHSGIGKLANLIKLGKAEDSLALFSHHNDITYQTINSSDDYQQAIMQCVQSYQFYLQQINKNSVDPKQVLNNFGQFRLLCALREGIFGVVGLNKVIETELNKKNLIQLKKNDAWYSGRPIMILKNNASLGLFNGDIGITLWSPNQRLRVYFLMPNGEVKGFSPYSLPEHETAYAMTIHKSQGSEFDQVSIILPSEYSPLLTRSLLYTGITRAKRKVTIYTNDKILKQTIHNQTKRRSGLFELLN